MNKPHLQGCPNIDCHNNKDCCPFRKIVIPAVMGDDTGKFKPENGAYYNTLVKYEANGTLYFYANDGAWTKVEEPVNDATLTIKQGDETLGTFSANASVDVEVNIPEDTAIRLRVEWTGGNEPEGWTPPNGEDGVRYSHRPGTGTSGYANIIEFEIPDASFVNEETEENLTAIQVFSLLEAGDKIILDNVPLGAYYPYSSDMIRASTVVGNIELSAKVVDSVSEVPTPNTGYTGGAYVRCEEAGISTYLGVRLTSYSGDVSFCVQGRGHYYPEAA